MKIIEVNDEHILFNNCNIITCEHIPDCCESNYADFTWLTPDVYGYSHDFDENLQFEKIDDAGFIFKDEHIRIFIPCYSDQNGNYSNDVNIKYNGIDVLNLRCIERDC